MRLFGVRKSMLLYFALSTIAAAAPGDTTRPVEGIKRNVPAVHAITNAKIVVRAGQVIDSGILIIRDGVIVDVGADVAVPADARIWDMSGKTVYPGFVDPYSEFDVDVQKSRGATSYWNDSIAPELRVVDQWNGDDSKNKAYREQGVTVRLVAPDEGVVRGVSTVVACGDREADQSVVRHDAVLHVRLGGRRGAGGYPASPMGAVAIARQSFYDSQWHHDAWRAYRTQSGLSQPEQNRSLEVLNRLVDSGSPIFFNTPDEQYIARAEAFAREFGLNAVFVGSGHEYRRLADVKATGRSVIVPLRFPKAPNVATPEAANAVSLEELMHWDLAPENPGRLANAGVDIALTAHGLNSTGDLWKSIRTAVKRGLDADAALRAFTETPSKLLGIQDRVGTLEPGKLAHFVVADGDLFREKSKIDETWIGGVRYEIQARQPIDIRGDWTVRTKPRFVVQLTGKAKALSGKVKRNENSVDLKKPKLDGELFTATFDASIFGDDKKGVVRLSAIVLPARDNSNTLTGSIVLPDGGRHAFSAVWSEPTSEAGSEADEAKDNKNDKPDTEVAAKEESEESESTTSNSNETSAADVSDNSVVSSFDVNYPLGAFGVESVADRPEAAAFINATVWTCSDAKTIKNASVVVRNGVIEAVGQDIEIPENALKIDCEGKHLSPGIIDCHSHMATDGGVNEGSQVITSEVRIGDFIDANEIAIYRQLAGGVTTANVLHGSANPIGGQNQVVKLRWGMNSVGLKFQEAPAGIKFALGENVKRSRSPSSRRYPRTRMGVEQIIRDAFLRARQYRDRWIAWEKERVGLPPRRDLELDALVEILDKKRWIHCHSYRQDEILSLLRTLESFNVRIGTLQHILEGYKIAEAMKQHGAMGSSFSDWWAYKFEVYDAIPYNGSIMHNVGVEVSFNSDDRELARHLNHEAAKAVKYGGVDPVEALKFVTLNPAKQLRIDHLVGSVEVGKHADLVVWSGNPLSTMSRCEQTWVDGRKHFDFREDRKNRKKWSSMRHTLVQKILGSGAPMRKPGEKENVAERNYWTRVDIYCTHRGNQVVDRTYAK